MIDDYDIILTSRLREAYWPMWIDDVVERAKRSRTLKPIDFVPDDKRGDVRSYDVRRVLWFASELRAGKSVDPIDVDAKWVHSRPSGVLMFDGHHRFAAAVIVGEERLPANLGGPCDMIEWLKGDVMSPPGWM